MSEELKWFPSPFAPPDPERLIEPLHVSFRSVVDLWPTRPAVLHGDQVYSFSDLLGRIESLAHQIQALSQDLGPIALVQSLGVDAVAAWFACSMTGRPFLLLEPGHPPARLSELIEAADAPLIICDDHTEAKLPSDLRAKILLPEEGIAGRAVARASSAQAPAMIFPTSGSTGRPKLVTYSVQTIQAKVQSSIRLFNFEGPTRVLIAGSHGNYGFLHHALVFLLSGNGLCLADVKADGLGAFFSEIERLDVRHIRFTPSLFRTIARAPGASSALKRLDGVRFSGEPLLRSDLDLALGLLSPSCQIQNVYGSTESGLFLWSSNNTIDEDAGTVPIGFIYPLNSYALRPLADAPEELDTGELVIRSAYHALGDWDEGAVNGARFQELSAGIDDRLYETKDIARRLPDNSLVLLGRAERMSKIRGQRVFLSEVENHLRAMPGVTGAAVLEVMIEEGAPELVGFITRKDDVWDALNARSWLAGRLPDFMLPRQIIGIDAIPLLAGGKVDYEALKGLVPSNPTADDGIEHQVTDYERLQRIWQSVLGPGAENADNDFFAFGGDSLKLLNLSLAIEREFGCELSIDQFLEDPTLSGLAVWLNISPRKSKRRQRTKLRARLVAASKSPSKGIALAMPGYNGSAHVVPFVEADMFPGYDIWAVDASVEKGSLLKGGRWWRYALKIARQINSGDIPAPRIIFGYSLGGGIAWLVSRFLAGTPYSPEFVLLVDATPMHRMWRYRSLGLELALAFSNRPMTSRIHHIKRASFVGIGIELGQAHLWHPEDAVHSTTEVPTMDHLSMGRTEILRSALGGVADFLNGKLLLREHRHLILDHLRVHLTHEEKMIRELLFRQDHQFDEFLEDILVNLETIDQSHLLWPAVYIVLRDGSLDQVRSFLSEGIRRYPSSRLFRYASFRLERGVEDRSRYLGSLGISGLPSLAAVDSALSHRADVMHTSINITAVHKFFKLYDVMRAILHATFRY